MLTKDTLSISLRTVFERAQRIAAEQQAEINPDLEALNSVQIIQEIIDTFGKIDHEVNFPLLALAFNDPDIYMDYILETPPRESQPTPLLVENTLTMIGLILTSAIYTPPVLEKLLAKLDRLADSSSTEKQTGSASIIVGNNDGAFLEITLSKASYQLDVKELKLHNVIATEEMLSKLAQNAGSWLLSYELIPKEAEANFKFDKSSPLSKQEQRKKHTKSTHQTTQLDLTYLNHLFRKHQVALRIEVYRPHGKAPIAYRLVKLEEPLVDWTEQGTAHVLAQATN
jgi:hypothetical protein